MIEIKSRGGRVLYTAQSAADIRTALEEAVAARADLSSANLHSANLSLADLHSANLAGAKKFNPARINHLSILAYQTGKIRAFKLVDSDLRSPMQRNGKITYEIGSIAECAKANTNQSKQCAAGLNVATAPWVLANFRPGHRIVLIEFTAKDLAAIPIGDGKFRLRRCKVIREVKPEEFGIDADGRDLVAQTEGQTHE